jgi:hypothetical protein
VIYLPDKRARGIHEREYHMRESGSGAFYRWANQVICQGCSRSSAFILGDARVRYRSVSRGRIRLGRPFSFATR